MSKFKSFSSLFLVMVFLFTTVVFSWGSMVSAAPEIALAVTQQGSVGAVMGEGATGISTINPSTVQFDRKSPADVSVTITTMGFTFLGIKNGSVKLQPGTDFVVSGYTVTIMKRYIEAQTSETIKLSFDFGFTENPVLTIKVSPGIISGDINGDTAVDALDYALMKQHLLRKTTLVGYGLKSADLNQDNTVDALDLAIIKMYLLKQITSLPVTQ